MTGEITWNCMEFCKMGTYAIINDTREVSPQVAKDCKANFEYILDFRAASGLALALKFFFMYQTTTKISQGISKVSDSFFGGIISAIVLLATELVKICDSRYGHCLTQLARFWFRGILCGIIRLKETSGDFEILQESFKTAPRCSGYDYRLLTQRFWVRIPGKVWFFR
jgi:hypothetical protein